MAEVLVALQLLSAAGGAASAGYKLLEAIEKAHPGAKLTKDHEVRLAAADPWAHTLLLQNGAKFAADFE